MLSEFFRTYVNSFLSPTFFIALTLLTGMFLLWKNHIQKAKIILTVSTIVFFLSTMGPLRYILFSITENTSSYKVNGPVKFIVVLGGKVFPDSDRPTSSQITSNLLSRVIEGTKLAYEFPEAKIIVTGNGASKVPEAVLMRKMVRELGISDDRIIEEKESMSTADHPRILKSILGSERFVIVTSAYHMDRALRLFRAQGLDPIPVPTDFINKTTLLTPRSFTVRGENLAAMDIWFQEFYSKMWNFIVQ